MNINNYTSFWEQQLIAINNKIKTAEASEYVINSIGLEDLGNREKSGYDGSVSLWMGEIDSQLHKAVFRDFAKALNINNKNLLPKAIGRLHVSIKNNNNLHVKYQPISFESILDKYEELQQKDNYLSEEIYKWDLTKNFQDQWKLYETKAISFKEFFGNINFRNLTYHVCITIYNHILREKPDEFEKIIAYLFDESIDLQTRIIEYKKQFDELYFSLPNHGANTYEEERTIATLLAFRYPEKYTFYKDNFYTKLCKGLGLQVQKPIYKLVHYYSIIDQFRTNYLSKRNALIQKNKATLTISCNPDVTNLILCQDVLYTTLISQIKSNYTEEGIGEDDRPINDEIDDKKTTLTTMQHPLNQILYGPPGTGKTYNAINKALEIINDNEVEKLDWNNRTAVKELFDKRVETGQIAFTTFHQSMSYEDFIEGIKPLEPEDDDAFLKYEVVPGIFKKICDDAKVVKVNSFDEVYEKFIEKITNSKDGEISLQTPNGNMFWLSINRNKNLNLFTGKLKQKNGTIKKEGLALEASGQKFFLGWESYSNGIFKYLSNNYGFVAKQKETETKPFVLIIDEINRGNVSQIFGELITLIEEDKRQGNAEALKVILPYSKKEFSVPANVYIIGTMNTADRSVEALDTALRRRFVFEEMPPKYDLPELQNEIFEFKAYEILALINFRIEKLLDKDHTIGHSYFINKTEETFITSFYKNVVPLLQEYFFGDYAKLGLVLGKGFVTSKNTDEAIFADFHYDAKDDYQSKEIFTIVDYRINNNTTGFAQALHSFMQKK